ncbi:MAG TPA: hypothetical protein VG733_16935 [Chthoniobacteraceae bacterium]|nr:hypothetical protein [Chthoniobacteraceae bacterium]
MKPFITAALLLSAVFTHAFAQEEAVHVQFIDNATGKVFGTADMPASTMPAKFDVGTALNIKGVIWKVVSSDPATREDFAKTGKLTLVVSKPEETSPAKPVLPTFAKPTLSGHILRATGDTPPGPGIFSIREADWRQVEFVSTTFAKEIGDEMNHIHAVRAGMNKNGTFDDIYSRSGIPVPVHDLTLKNMQELLPVLKKFQAVGYQGSPGTVPHSFAWVVDPGFILYGMADDDGNVNMLCVAGTPSKEHVAAISAALSKLTQKYDLYLVDWCKETRLDGDVPGFEKYFGVQ